MKIGMLTDSLPDLSFDAMLESAATLRIECLEFACGNWSAAPHIQLDRLLESNDARREFLAKISGRGLSISALNCSGNPLFPGAEGTRQRPAPELLCHLDVGLAPGIGYQLGVEVATTLVRAARSEWVIEGDFAAWVKSIATVESLRLMSAHTGNITIGKCPKLRMARP